MKVPLKAQITVCCLVGLAWIFVGGDTEANGEEASPIKRVIFGSCIKQDRPIPILATMKNEHPDLLLLTGDNIYGDTENVDELRAKYGRLRKDELFQSLTQSCQTLATWDDHDFGVNDGGATYSKRAESQQVFLDFWGVADDSPRRKRKGVFHSITLGPTGKRLQVILLDTRYHRSNLKKGERRVGGPYYPDPDSEKTMLGDQQWQWLEAQFRKPAELRLVVSSIQFIPSASGQECWANLPSERTRMLNLIRSTKVNGVFFVSGDRHWSEWSELRESMPYPIHDVTCSSLNQKHKRGTPTENRYRSETTTYHKENYGLLEIDWDASKPNFNVSIRDIDGNAQIEKRIQLSDLSPK